MADDVTYRRGELPPISEEEQARYKAMAEAQRLGLPSEIDFSDIPRITSLDGWVTVAEHEAHRAALRKERQAAKEAATV